MQHTPFWNVQYLVELCIVALDCVRDAVEVVIIEKRRVLVCPLQWRSACISVCVGGCARAGGGCVEEQRSAVCER